MASCAKRPTMPPPQEDILYQVEDFLAPKPDSALQILDTLNVDVLSEKERAHYCLLKVQVRDKFFLYDSITDSLLQVAENYFIGGSDKWFESKTCESLSRVAFKTGKGEQIKLDWLQKAVESIDQCGHVDERLIRFAGKPMSEQDYIDSYKYRLYMRLGMCYLDNEYQDECLVHLKKAESYFAKNQNLNMQFNTANMLGNAFLYLKEYDSCLFYFERGLDAAQQLGQNESVAYCHFSKSMFYRYRFEYQDYETEEEGQQLLWNAIAECHQGLVLYEEPMFRYKDGLYSELNKCFFQLEAYDSCIYYAEKQIDFLNAMRFEIVPNSENAGVFFRLHKSYATLGNMEKALECANRYFEMQQVIEKQPKAVEQVKSDYDKKIGMMQLQAEHQMKRYRLYLALSIVVLALVVVLWLANRYRKNKEIELLRQAEAYGKLQSEFDAASQQAQQALQQRVMAIYQSGGERTMERIMAEFVATYPQAADKLASAYPGLSDSERNIVVLSFLGFRMKEEADILNLSPNTVEKYRSNIRKKTNNDPVSDLIR